MSSTPCSNSPGHIDQLISLIQIPLRCTRVETKSSLEATETTREETTSEETNGEKTNGEETSNKEMNGEETKGIDIAHPDSLDKNDVETETLTNQKKAVNRLRFLGQ